MEKKPVSKQSIRSEYLGRRNNLTKREREEKSAEIRHKLKQTAAFQEAEVVLVYLDYRSEVMTTALVEELLAPGSGKRVFAPKVEGMDIFFYEIFSLEDVAPCYQQIREPGKDESRLFGEKEAENCRCLVLTPGTVFDQELGRMGYGKGFYDRFLHKYPELTKAGLAFQCQIARRVPMTEKDERLDMIITESEVIGRATTGHREGGIN